MDIWALCRYHHGILWNEFQNLTLANIEALEERRSIELRYARFNAALVASAMNGVNPFEYVPGYEEDKAREEIKKGIVALFVRLPDDITPAEVQALRIRTIERLKNQGVEDADSLFSEVFPG